MQVNSMLDISNAVQDAKEKWHKDNTLDAIQKQVSDKLDTQVQQVLMQILGFSKDSWNRSVWEVDHCNGRAGNSIAGTSATELATRTLDTWMKQHEQELVSHINTKIEAAVKKELNNVLEYKLRAAVTAAVESELSSISTEIVQKELKDLSYEASKALAKSTET